MYNVSRRASGVICHDWHGRHGPLASGLAARIFSSSAFANRRRLVITSRIRASTVICISIVVIIAQNGEYIVVIGNGRGHGHIGRARRFDCARQGRLSVGY